MKFCPKCQTVFNISKNKKGVQTGGQSSFNAALSKIRQGIPLTIDDIEPFRGVELTDFNQFNKLSKTKKNGVEQAIIDVDPEFLDQFGGEDDDEIVAYYVCKSCKYHVPIDPGTTIYSINYGKKSDQIEDYSYSIHDNTLQRTRVYICKNPACKTHKNPEIREAILTKTQNEQLVYVCTVCGLDWLNAP